MSHLFETRFLRRKWLSIEEKTTGIRALWLFGGGLEDISRPAFSCWFYLGTPASHFAAGFLRLPALALAGVPVDLRDLGDVRQHYLTGSW